MTEEKLTGISKDKSIGFIIPTYLVNEQQYKILSRNIELIHQHHHQSKIVLIDDNSPYSYTFEHNPLLLVVKALNKTAGEVHAYWYWYHWKWFDHAIILHDCCEIHCNIPYIESGVKYLWFFDNHREWENVILDDDIKTANIKTHLDEIVVLIKCHPDKECAEKMLETLLHHSNLFICCWGLMSIMSYDFLVETQKKTKWLDLYPFIKGRRNRMAMETIFSIVCYLTLDVEELGIEYVLQSFCTKWITHIPNSVIYSSDLKNSHMKFHGPYVSKHSFSR
jgi:hypothetical protein